MFNILLLLLLSRYGEITVMLYFTFFIHVPFVVTSSKPKMFHLKGHKLNYTNVWQRERSDCILLEFMVKKSLD